MPVSQDPGTVPVPCGPLLAFRFTKVNEKNAKKSLTAWKPAKTHRHIMTLARWVNAFTSLSDALRWSLGVRSVEASAQKRGGTNSRGARRPSCFGTMRFTLYRIVSIRRLTARDPTGSP